MPCLAGRVLSRLLHLHTPHPAYPAWPLVAHSAHAPDPHAPCLQLHGLTFLVNLLMTVWEYAESRQVAFTPGLMGAVARVVAADQTAHPVSLKSALMLTGLLLEKERPEVSDQIAGE